MANTIKMRRSATQGAVPTTAQLALGELALNTYDGALYTKKSVNGTESIVKLSGVNGDIALPASGTLAIEDSTGRDVAYFSNSETNFYYNPQLGNELRLSVNLNGVHVTGRYGQLDDMFKVRDSYGKDHIRVLPYGGVEMSFARLGYGQGDYVELCYGDSGFDGSQEYRRLETTSTGVKIYGNLDAPSATIGSSGGATLKYGAATRLSTTSTGTSITGDLSVSGALTMPTVSADKLNLTNDPVIEFQNDESITIREAGASPAVNVVRFSANGSYFYRNITVAATTTTDKLFLDNDPIVEFRGDEEILIRAAALGVNPAVNVVSFAPSGTTFHKDVSISGPISATSATIPLLQYGTGSQITFQEAGTDKIAATLSATGSNFYYRINPTTNESRLAIGQAGVYITARPGFGVDMFNVKDYAGNKKFWVAEYGDVWAGYAALGYGASQFVELYNGTTKRLETTSTGVTITGSLTAGGLTYPTTNGTFGQVLTSNGTGGVIWDDAAGGTTITNLVNFTDTVNSINVPLGGTIYVEEAQDIPMAMFSVANGVWLAHDDVYRLKTQDFGVEISGHLLPSQDSTFAGTRDLGSPTKRWSNVYTGDLQLSNEGSANEVDGTWGNYTIQEGEDDLFLINRRSGKKYKFMLQEVQ